MKRDRAWRRDQTKRVQIKRIKAWESFGTITKEKHKGMMRKTHFGCGCKMRKPWKHFGNADVFGERYSHSERKRRMK